MSAGQNSAIFSEHAVTPDVLSSDGNLPYDLIVSWPETTLSKPGEELDREQTQPQPKLALSPAVTTMFTGNQLHADSPYSLLKP